MITSFKGGVGKTTVCSGIACALSKLPKRVVAIDMDFGTRGLDIALGMENIIADNIMDVLIGKTALNNAICATEKANLAFISSPSNFKLSDFNEIIISFDEILIKLKEQYDIVLLDMPAGNSVFFDLIEGSKEINYALVVTTDNVNSLRAAEKTAMELLKRGIENIRLLINSYRLDDAKKNQNGIVDIIKKTSIPIIGIVPYDIYAESALASGVSLCDMKKSAAKPAFKNVARRICGEKVILLDGIVRRKERVRFY